MTATHHPDVAGLTSTEGVDRALGPWALLNILNAVEQVAEVPGDPARPTSMPCSATSSSNASATSPDPEVAFGARSELAVVAGAAARVVGDRCRASTDARGSAFPRG